MLLGQGKLPFQIADPDLLLLNALIAIEQNEKRRLEPGEI